MDLWWNPIHLAAALVGGVIGAWIVALLLAFLVRRGLSMACGELFRREKRFTAAIHYGTAWSILFVLAALVASLRPVSYIGQMAKWRWYPPAEAFALSAAVLAGLGAVLWWYWLVRLGATAPGKIRGTLTTFFAVGVPVLAAVAAAGWYFGLRFAFDPLFRLLRVEF